MAYQPSNHSQHGRYGSYQSSSQIQSQHGRVMSQSQVQGHFLHRMSSFDQGDDATYPTAVNGSGTRIYGSRTQRAGSNTSAQYDDVPAGRQNVAYPFQSTTNAPNSGGYQHQDFPPTPSYQASYNPQLYSATHAQYHLQSPTGTAASNISGYPPYNPAAYQPSMTLPQPPYSYQTQQSYLDPSGSRSPVQPPPVPPRPYEHQNDNSTISFDTTPLPSYGYQPQETYHRPPLPPTPNTAPLPSRSTYTPPAPPPPPFSPDRDAFPSMTSTTSRRYSHRNSLSQPSHVRNYEQPPSIQSSLPPIPRHSSSSSFSARYPDHQTTSPSFRSGSSLPPTPGTPGPTPPQHSPQHLPQHMGMTGTHPHRRPLPGPPSSKEGYFGDPSSQSDSEAEDDEEPAYGDLMKEVEAAVMGRGSRLNSRSNHHEIPADGQQVIGESQVADPLFSSETSTDTSSSPEANHANGNVATIGIGHDINYGNYSDQSEAEALAGLAAMHMADEQDAAEELRKNSGAGSAQGSVQRQRHPRHSRFPGESSSDSDVHVDMDTYGGGFSGHIHYGDQPVSEPSQPTTYPEHRPSLGASSSQRSEISGDSYDIQRASYSGSISGYDDMRPFPPTLSARVDTGGTGGLAEPTMHPRRLSFDDGDEIILAESEGARDSGQHSSSTDEMPDMFFHPGHSSKRSLPTASIGALAKNRVPQLMPAGTYQNPDKLHQYDQHGRVTYPPAPDAYSQLLSPSGTPVPRSSSLISHGSAPQTVTPLRSKTDADRARIKQQQLMGLRSASPYGEMLDSSVSQSAELLGLPEIPAGKRKKFNPSKLSTNDFKKCAEPWALSSITAWIKEMSEGETDLKEQAIVDGIVALFLHKVPTMNATDAESLGARVVKAMFQSDVLMKEEEWVRFGVEPMCGVLYQMTGTGCYSARVHAEPSFEHTQPFPSRCYSHHCMRTLKKINLQAQVLEPQRKVEDWATFYKVTKNSIEAASRKEVERQNILHEIVTTEDAYMDQINVLRILYRDELARAQPPIITPKKKDSFLRDVFGKVEIIKQINEDHLLPQLKYRQQEQGPWVVGFSDIFREWVRKAKVAYVDYAASFPNASFLVRQEAERNILFRNFLDAVRDNERSKRLGWDTYLKAPITRLQRYSLLLSTVAKNMPQDSEEKNNLRTAIEEIKAVTLECDMRVAEMSKNVELAELASKLQLRSGMEKVQLNLTHLGREIIFKGDLQRTGSNKFTWLEIYAILFDHYLVLSKRSIQRDTTGGKQEKYDVSKLPIPMDLLVLETTNDDPVVKSSVKGIGAVTTITTKVQMPQDIRPGRQSVSNANGAGVPGTLVHTDTGSSTATNNTANSTKTITTPIVLEPKDENLMFPFKIRHLGKAEVYTLYAPSAQNRLDWCNKIIQAKTRHAASLFKQNAEPFRLRVVADSAFGYDSMSSGTKSIIVKGTPLDRAIREIEEIFGPGDSRPGPVCRAQVNCAAAFNQPHGNPMLAIGTDYGVFISEYSDPRGWKRAITANKVTQIAVLEEFSLFLLIADKALIAHHLDSVCPVSGNTASVPNSSSDASSRRAPQRLSGNRDVGFFATGRMKDRTLVFYKKRDGISSTFKVLEPVYQKSTAGAIRSRFGIRKGTTEYFRDFDDFYIPSETYAINLFHSSLAIATAKGFEVMTLEKKTPLSIPDLKQPECASIAHRLREQKPLGMFRLGDSEFLLVFEEVGIYVDKLGDVSRAVVMEFVGKAKQAALYGRMYLVLVDEGGRFVEVRNAVNGRLRQVVSGKDIRLLDDGMNTGSGGSGGGKGNVKICMQHPEWERCQVVVEMVVNEGLKE